MLSVSFCTKNHGSLVGMYFNPTPLIPYVPVQLSSEFASLSICVESPNRTAVLCIDIAVWVDRVVTVQRVDLTGESWMEHILW